MSQPAPNTPSAGGPTRVISHRFETQAGQQYPLVCYRGQEQLGRTYRFEIYFLVENNVNLDARELVGARAKLSTQADDFEPLVFHGILTEVGLVEAFARSSLFVAQLEPELARAALGRHTRVFVDQDINAVLKTMFEGLGFSGEQFALPSTGASKHAQICQFEESDLNFMTRRMEAAGLHYYFEQAEGAERVVVVDGTPMSEDLKLGELSYGSKAGLKPWCVSHLRSTSRLGVGALAVSAYNANNPSVVAAAGDTDGSKPQGVGISIGWDDETGSAAAIDVDAWLNLEASVERVRKETYAGACNAPVLSAGRHFRLEYHPRPEFDCDYYVTQVAHRGSQACDEQEVWQVDGVAEVPGGYAASFQAVRATVTYRLPRETPVPRIHGIRSAVIDGSIDEDYAQLDDAGRYLVKLRHDESTHPAGGASMWVRMLQPSAGNPEGMHFPLRKGTEVMLVFLDGDPDRPLIAGAVPNALNPSPVTSANRTLNVLHTGGNNHFELEDQDGAQHIQLKTPTSNTELYQGAARVHGGGSYNLIQLTEGAALLKVGADRDVAIGGSLSHSVSGDQSLLVLGDRKMKIVGDLDDHVSGDYDGHVDGDYELTVDGDYDVTHKNDTIETYIGASSESYLGAKNENFFGILNSNAAGLVNENFYGDVTSNSYAVVNENFFGVKNENFLGIVVSNCFSDTQELVVGNSMEIGLGGRLDVLVGQSVDIALGGSLSCEGGARTMLHVGVKVNLALAAEINVVLLGINASGIEISGSILNIDAKKFYAEFHGKNLRKTEVAVEWVDSKIYE